MNKDKRVYIHNVITTIRIDHMGKQIVYCYAGLVRRTFSKRSFNDFQNFVVYSLARTHLYTRVRDDANPTKQR